MYTNLKTHLLRKHRDENDMQKALKSSPRTQNRIINLVRNYGINRHNEKNSWNQSCLIRKRNQGSKRRVMCNGNRPNEYSEITLAEVNLAKKSSGSERKRIRRIVRRSEKKARAW